MLNVRSRKVLRDLRQQWGRAVMVIVAMALGVVGTTAISTSYYVAKREQRDAFLGSHPVSATLVVDGLTPQALTTVRAVPGVDAAGSLVEAPGARIRVPGGDWVPMHLTARTDDANMTIARPIPQTGAWPPPPGQIVVESSSDGAIRTVKPGDTVEVELPGSATQTLTVAGTVNDPSLAPGWVEGGAYGFVTTDTMARLDPTATPRRLRLLIGDNRLDRAQVEAVTAAVSARLTAAGARVASLDVPNPGEHPHQKIMDAMLGLELLFGALALTLSALLTVTVVSALLSGQVRQIGTLKAVGARTGQILGGYAAMIAALGGIACAAGWTLGRLAGLAYADFVALFMNFEIADTAMPAWLIAAQLLTGLAVPVLTMGAVLWRATRITAAQAMREHGAVRSARTATGLAAALSARRLPRLPLMGVRNAFRRRARLILAASALAIAGGIFMAAGNLTTGLEQTFVESEIDSEPYDVSARVDKPYPIDRLTAAVATVPGVSRVEGWLTVPATAGAAETVSLQGVDAASPVLDLAVLDGHALTQDGRNELVVSQGLALELPDVRVGTDLTLQIAGRATTWHVVGVARTVRGGIAWVSRDDLAAALGTPGTVNTVRIVTTGHDLSAVQTTQDALDRALTGAGMTVVGRTTLFDTRKILEEHKVIFNVLLNLMTLLSVVVGGMGLAITLTVSVVERTREIGVLRAIGSTTAKLLTLIGVEAAVTGAVSWVLALALAGPATVLFDQLFGNLLLNAPLAFAVNGPMIAAWLAIVTVFCALASIVPARRAAAMTVSDTLAYE
ncbi:FtsX-like permease family protein [Dactylosporangium roseum]|uniref:FtsX-like permease family protein n=1 Tax=Dactylosporangium roseum TaxID=47989 RepID=A0ABY5Z2U7_9ACTN|nr:FtsX-like permease family protein [Dactylosporangium roseum]UWZ36351.1 FtsX-like permease family protein [Dactylosporangium roseum]